ncbi:Os11g0168250 [Oryza sativa Japonica Group]|uniref:Os11g0168250 protein n=1 Tax=Oryza sativa subsp. japonica TaxID=39947 RepID=A0A0N7KSH6_ORYSJ|nr:hypothetical protein EE612_053728 [Oryza sativa]BAT12842.1 Os11g0168250 [Oryza sativa Japonica Group]
MIVLTNSDFAEEPHKLSLELAEEPLFLVGGLEATVPELGRGVDELELDLLERQTRGLLEQGLAEGDDPLLGANTATLDHEVVALHNTVVREATHGSDTNWYLSNSVQAAWLSWPDLPIL